jgi:hypothetical protein
MRCIDTEGFNLTIDKEYAILESKEGKVKVRDDIGKHIWCSHSSFSHTFA